MTLSPKSKDDPSQPLHESQAISMRRRMGRLYDAETTRLATRVPKSLHRRLRLHCVQKGITIVSFVTEAVHEKLHGRRKKSTPKPEE